MSQITTQTRFYCLLDGARIFGEMDTAKRLQPEFLSLYMGENDEKLKLVAPYLFSYQAQSEFENWFLENGWGNSWGIFIETTANLQELRTHLRKFLFVKSESGKDLYFRYYDPRVLRIFLPTCSEEQLQFFFGPIKKIICEDKAGLLALQFGFLENELKIDTKNIDSEFFL